MSKHSELPWETWGGGLNIRSKNKSFIASCGAHGYSLEELKANAAFIVCACNNYEKLLKVARIGEIFGRALRAKSNVWTGSDENDLRKIQQALQLEKDK